MFLTNCFQVVFKFLNITFLFGTTVLKPGNNLQTCFGKFIEDAS